jgi:hypothetical protein
MLRVLGAFRLTAPTTAPAQLLRALHTTLSPCYNPRPLPPTHHHHHTHPGLHPTSCYLCLKLTSCCILLVCDHCVNTYR